MIYRTTNLYQCLVFIIFMLKLSSINGDNETTTSAGFTEFSGRIVGGTKVEYGKFSYIVALRRSTSMTAFCSGSLIRDRWALTAAHCMVINGEVVPPSTILVTGGELQLNPSTPHRQTSILERIILHPEFSKFGVHNDIGLLLLETPFKVNKYLQLTRWLPNGPSPRSICTVAGWGITAETHTEMTNDLRSVTVPLFSYNECLELLGKDLFIESKLCAGYMEGGRDACQGDSGGPLECGGLLAGIVSAGMGCARPKQPGIYTKVASYTDWIEKTIAPVAAPSIAAGLGNTISCGIIPRTTLSFLFLSLSFLTVTQYIFLT